MPSPPFGDMSHVDFLSKLIIWLWLMLCSNLFLRSQLKERHFQKFASNLTVHVLNCPLVIAWTGGLGGCVLLETPEGPNLEESRLKNSISLGNFNLAWKCWSRPWEKFPTPKKALVDGSLDFSILLDIFKPRGRSFFFNFWALTEASFANCLQCYFRKIFLWDDYDPSRRGR